MFVLTPFFGTAVAAGELSTMAVFESNLELTYLLAQLGFVSKPSVFGR